MEFKPPPPMALEPGVEGVWLFKPMTQHIPDDELVGLTTPVAPKDWEKPASLLTELKLQELKDPDLVFAPCPDILPYEDIFGKDHKVRTWEDVMEDREEMTIRSWAEDLNGKDMRYGRKDRKMFTYKVLKKLGDANMAKEA